MGFGTFNGFFSIFSIVWLLIAGVIVCIAVSGIKQWHKNNNSPRLTVNAKVISKRMDVSHHHHHDNHAMCTSSTFYYATFEFESGDRLEFNVGRDYGYIVEGDSGKLTFQGTRYISFER